MQRFPITVRRGFALSAVVALASGTMLLAGGSPSGAAPQSQTFGFTGAVQPFVVPDGVFAITVDAFGAQGGDGTSDGEDIPVGGLGGRATGVICVTPGETLQVSVGGTGTDSDVTPESTSEGDADSSGDVVVAALSPGGFPDGGDSPDGETPGGGGGGSSDVRRGPYSLTDRLIVGGGGGGGGGADSDATPPASQGGIGGGSAGGPGEDSYDTTPGGGGGTQQSGGVADTAFDPSAVSGSFGAGGDGGEGADDQNDIGGGGGGGWYGGAGGAGNGGDGVSDDGGGGGGGSGYGPADVAFQAGVRAGNGAVTISWDPDAITAPCVRFTG